MVDVQPARPTFRQQTGQHYEPVVNNSQRTLLVIVIEVVVAKIAKAGIEIVGQDNFPLPRLFIILADYVVRD